MKHLVKAGLLSTALLVGFNTLANSASAVACENSGTSTGCNQSSTRDGAHGFVGAEDTEAARVPTPYIKKARTAVGDIKKVTEQ